MDVIFGDVARFTACYLASIRTEDRKEIGTELRLRVAERRKQPIIERDSDGFGFLIELNA